MSALKPTKKQLDFQDWEFGIFNHFGIRTFYEGHKDWDGKKMDPEKFQPDQLDCGQWADTARNGGARYMVLTAKHHDGFANWPSKYTDFSVASSSWRDGEGDVVKEFTDACRKHQLKVGLYYSPADANCPVYQDEREYDDYFIKQVSELLDGRYGEINMIWFDGCGSENHQYDWPRVISEIRRMQPNILIFNMGDPDYRWVGNEAGLAHLPNWNVVDSIDFSIMTDEKETVSDGKRWLPAECDFMIRDVNWFYSDGDEHTVKSVEELLGVYYYSVGRGCNMLMNIGPDRRGLLPDKDAKTLISLGKRIRSRFGAPIATLKDFNRTRADQWTWSSPNYERKSDDIAGAPLVDHVVAMEDLTNGERVRRFRVKVVPYLSGAPVTVHEGRNIGHKAICQFPPVRCKEVSLEILESDDQVELREISLHSTLPPRSS